jgi:hypothetical protein
MSAPGSAENKSFGQEDARSDACAVRSLSWTSGGLPSIGSSRGNLSTRLRLSAVRNPVSFRFLLAQRSEDRGRQHLLDEDVLLEDQPFAFARRPQRPEQVSRSIALMEIIPGLRRPDEFHESQSKHGFGAARRQIEGKSRAPVLSNEHETIQPHRIDENSQVPGVVCKAAFDVGLAGPAETDQVGRNAAGERRDVRDDVSPDIRRCRIAVTE